MRSCSKDAKKIIIRGFIEKHDDIALVFHVHDGHEIMVFILVGDQNLQLLRQRFRVVLSFHIGIPLELHLVFVVLPLHPARYPTNNIRKRIQ